jgi:hypothetical protein
MRSSLAHDMAAAKSAETGVLDAKSVGTSESLSACRAMDPDEMPVMSSCLMPFGIMTGDAGKWMVGYQFMHDDMDDSLVGTHSISTSQILKQFPSAPTDMTMDMHMGMVMYAPTQKLTLTAMVPYALKEMNNVNADGSRFVERTSGLGDVELGGSYQIFQNPSARHRLLLSGGMALPTGAIDKKMDGFQLEYCMQPGSGTVALLPGVTYLGQTTAWSWGADFHATVRLGRNDHDYRFGNIYQSRTWVMRQLGPWLSVSAGLNGVIWETIHSADPGLDPSMEQTADPNLQAGKRLDASFGLTFCPMPCCHGGAPCCSTAQTKFSNGQQVFVEGRLPIIQSLDGPQLETNWSINVGWQWMF